MYIVGCPLILLLLLLFNSIIYNLSFPSFNFSPVTNENVPCLINSQKLESTVQWDIMGAL